MSEIYMKIGLLFNPKEVPWSTSQDLEGLLYKFLKSMGLEGERVENNGETLMMRLKAGDKKVEDVVPKDKKTVTMEKGKTKKEDLADLIKKALNESKDN